MIVYANTTNAPKPNFLGLGAILYDDYVFIEQICIIGNAFTEVIEATFITKDRKKETIFLEIPDYLQVLPPNFEGKAEKQRFNRVY